MWVPKGAPGAGRKTRPGVAREPVYNGPRRPRGTPEKGRKIFRKLADLGCRKGAGPTAEMRPVDARRWQPQNSRLPPENSRHANCQGPTKAARPESAAECARRTSETEHDPEVKEGHRNKDPGVEKKSKGTPKRKARTVPAIDFEARARNAPQRRDPLCLRRWPLKGPPAGRRIEAHPGRRMEGS